MADVVVADGAMIIPPPAPRPTLPPHPPRARQEPAEAEQPTQSTPILPPHCYTHVTTKRKKPTNKGKEPNSNTTRNGTAKEIIKHNFHREREQEESSQVPTLHTNTRMIATDRMQTARIATGGRDAHVVPRVYGRVGYDVPVAQSTTFRLKPYDTASDDDDASVVDEANAYAEGSVFRS